MTVFGKSKFTSHPLLNVRYVLVFHVLTLNFLFASRFICDNCHKARGTKRKDNPHTAKRLPTSTLGKYIEARVNNFLKKKEAHAGDVHIRVVFSGDKQVEVKPLMKAR